MSSPHGRSVLGNLAGHRGRLISSTSAKAIKAARLSTETGNAMRPWIHHAAFGTQRLCNVLASSVLHIWIQGSNLRLTTTVHRHDDGKKRADAQRFSVPTARVNFSMQHRPASSRLVSRFGPPTSTDTHDPSCRV